MTLVFKQSVETNKEALCVKLGSDRGSYNGSSDHVFLLSRRVRSLRNRAPGPARHARMRASICMHARL